MTTSTAQATPRPLLEVLHEHVAQVGARRDREAANVEILTSVQASGSHRPMTAEEARDYLTGADLLAPVDYLPGAGYAVRLYR